jgi:predicted RNase H-like HicB family nuclease
MEMKLTIIYEVADDLVQASVAELPGAISLGKTREEARANLAEAIEMVLEGNRLLAGNTVGEREEVEFRAA